ncbi:MAG: hypothetical protein ACLP9L_42035, partial [Thermoguttaceae bacterium]
AMAAISRILRLLTRIRLPNYVGTSASIRPLKSLAVELTTLRRQVVSLGLTPRSALGDISRWMN